MLKISQEHLNQILTHAEQIYPEECCGILLGKISDYSKIIVEVWPTENTWNKDDSIELFNRQGSKKDRFTIAPEILLKAQKEARDRQLNIIGIYHSHPNHPAIPSEFDRAIAWPEYSYIIVSVIQGKAKDIFSWILDDDRQFKQEKIT
jgi:proteasome lid subunit RPN8/RPN11